MFFDQHVAIDFLDLLEVQMTELPNMAQLVRQSACLSYGTKAQFNQYQIADSVFADTGSSVNTSSDSKPNRSHVNSTGGSNVLLCMRVMASECSEDDIGCSAMR